MAFPVTEVAEDVKEPGDGMLWPRLNNSEVLNNLEDFVKHLPFSQRAELLPLFSIFLCCSRGTFITVALASGKKEPQV